MTDERTTVEPGGAGGAEWRRGLVHATEAAIARLQHLDDPAHAALLAELRAFRERIATDPQE